MRPSSSDWLLEPGMDESLFRSLRCPFCGGALTLVDNDTLTRTGNRIEAGVAGCECCAFPIVSGIPVLIADDTTREAIFKRMVDKAVRRGRDYKIPKPESIPELKKRPRQRLLQTLT